MNIKDKLNNRMYPQDFPDGTYLAARADSGQRFLRHTVNVHANGISAIETSSDPLPHYILISRVEKNEDVC